MGYDVLGTNYSYLGVIFECTCSACPEQYDAYLDGTLIGYIRLRWGRLRADWPDVRGETVYSYDFDDGWKGCFDSNEERNYHLEKIVEALLNRNNEKTAEC